MARKYIHRNLKSRRETLWIGGSESDDGIGAAAAVLVAGFNAAALALRPFTIVRTRGVISVRSDQVSAGENQFVQYGMSVVSDQAFAIGVTAVPTPFTDQGSDLFFVHEMIANRFEFITGVGFYSVGNRAHYFDSKAMRKVNDDESLAVVKETTTASLGASVYDSFRMLVKLH